MFFLLLMDVIRSAKIINPKQITTYWPEFAHLGEDVIRSAKIINPKQITTLSTGIAENEKM